MTNRTQEGIGIKALTLIFYPTGVRILGFLLDLRSSPHNLIIEDLNQLKVVLVEK